MSRDRGIRTGAGALRGGLPLSGLLALLAACGGNAPPPAWTPGAAAARDTAACALPALSSGPPESGAATAGRVASAGPPLRLGLEGSPASSDAPRPRGSAERLLFRQMYATLVRVDCAGRTYPALARSWSSGDGGRSWTFELDPDSRFWDGSPVTARTVAASWSPEEPALLDAEGIFRPPPPRPSRIQVLGDLRLRVELARPVAAAAFADPWLGVAGEGRWMGWPAGSGASPAGVEAEVDADPRDLLDRGVDLLVTRRAPALRYAATLPGYRVVPLPWERVYALVLPRGGADGSAADRKAPPTLREELAAEAVREEARPAAAPYWWRDGTGCEESGDADRSPGSGAGGGAVARPDAGSAASAVRYVRGDSVAAQLAARLVALAGSGRLPAELELGSGASAVAVDPSGLAAGLEAGGPTASLLALPRRVLDRCSALLRLGPLAARLVPLVETRARAVVAARVQGGGVDWDGVPRLPSPPVAR